MVISKKIINLLESNEVISTGDKELYEYGLHQGFILLVNILTTIFIGWILNMVVESIVFLLAYMPLRSYAGGYHAKTQFRCYLLSVIMISLVLLIVKSSVWNLISVVFITVSSSLIIFLFAPVEDKNKALKETEKDEFKKRTNIFLGILLNLSILLWSIEQKQISISIILAFGMVSIMVLLEKLKVFIRKI